MTGQPQTAREDERTRVHLCSEIDESGGVAPPAAGRGSVGEDFPREQARLRELLEIYQDVGQAGAFAHAALSAVLARAEAAAISGDVVAVLRSYQEMRGCE